jgi:dTDP-4-dehydrorhamnose reductase
LAHSVLILGGGGMLGHKLLQRLRASSANVACTIRGSLRGSPLERIELFRESGVVEGVDAARFEQVERLLAERRPDVVVNCIGVIKQRAEAELPIPSITLNSLLPHRLAATVSAWGGRVVHFSTDCVFSGKKGGYTELDPSDAEDLYGKTKFLGEVATPNAITLRTSIVGRELTHHASLIDWFLSQNHGTVRGFTRHLYSGVTTLHLADVVADLIERHPRLSGLYQVTGPVITKHDLLCLIRDTLGLDIKVVEDPVPVCDRSMSGARFDGAVGRTAPSWAAMIEQLAKDPTP